MPDPAGARSPEHRTPPGASGIAIAPVLGGWAVQQAHAAGAPAVVLGCLTVIDPLVAVVLGATMLG